MTDAADQGGGRHARRVPGDHRPGGGHPAAGPVVRERDRDDDELITRSQLDLPADDTSEQAWNFLAYLMLVTEGADIDTMDFATRLVEAAVDGSQRARPELLDTLAVGRFKQGDSESVQDLLHKALRLTTGTDEKTRACAGSSSRGSKTSGPAAR